MNLTESCLHRNNGSHKTAKSTLGAETSANLEFFKVKISLKNENEIKSFSEQQYQRESLTRRSSLKEKPPSVHSGFHMQHTANVTNHLCCHFLAVAALPG